MSIADMNAPLPEWLHDLTGHGILITDSTLTICGWNRWLELHSGRAAAEVIGRHLLDVYPDLVARHLDQYYHQALAGQVVVLAQRLHHYLLPMPASIDQGSFEHMQQSARIRPLIEAGSIIGTTTVIDDVTERVAREDELSRLLAQEQAARERLAFLAESSGLLATSLDYETTLHRVARLMVPALADYCTIDILADDGQVQLVALAHQDAAKEAQLYELNRRYPRIESDDLPGLMAVRTGMPVIIPDLASIRRRDCRYDEEHRRQLEALSTRSVLATPLIARGQILGAITLCATQPDRYHDEELALAQDVARRAALAIDNARLYQQAQAALRARDDALAIVEAERAKLQRFFTQAPAGICILEGPEHRYAFANLRYRQMIGNRDLIGVTVREALPELAEQGFVDLLDQVYTSGESFIGTELPIQVDLHSNGVLETRNFNFVYQPTRDASGAVDGILVHIIDVTEQVLAQRERAELLDQAQRARAEAEAAVQVRDTFFSVAAHELKTPLTSLIGNIQLIQRRSMRAGLMQERDVRAFGVLAAQAQRLQQMIEALLDVTRLESGHLSLDRAPLDLNLLVQRVVEEVQPTLTQHTIDYQAPQQAYIVDSDALRMEQVLQNLIQNAVKYSPHGGTITITITIDQQGQSVCVSVRDQGIGIPPEALPRLFGRFYRANNVGEKHISGMGIGLYVVKEIITLHGGSVSVDSSVGVGSTFRVCLPLSPDQLESTPAQIRSGDEMTR